MKKFLLSLTLFTALLGVSFNAKAGPCNMGNLVFNIKSYTQNPNGTCTMTFDIGWDQENNSGYKYAVAHLWLTDNYPSYAYSSPGGAIPSTSDLNNTLGSVVLSRSSNGQPWGFTTYPGGATTLLTGILTTSDITINGKPGTRFLIQNATKTFNTCPTNLSVKGDIWGSQQGNNVSCHDANKVFLPPLANFDVTGSLTCAYKDGLPDNKFSVEMSSITTPETLPTTYTVSYNVYVDNNAPTSSGYVSGTEILVPSRSESNISVSPGNNYSSGSLTYLSSFSAANQYLYRTRTVYVVANVSYTQNGGGTFTRILTLTNTCQNQTVPAPTVNPDYFVLGMDGWEGNTSLKAHVYGNYTKWANDPIAAGYQVSSLSTSPAVNSGTDGDNTDAPLSAMKFTFSGLSLENGPACEAVSPNLGTLTTNDKGFFEYTLGDPCVNVVSFTYTIQNTLSLEVSAPIKVTIQISDPVILPVSYKSFSATRSSNSQVILEWETAMEENNRGFHVQRNTDGSWKNIGFVFSAAQGGNSSEVLKYAFKDANGSKGITQYRILQVDMDGKGKYSEVRAVRGLETAAARVTLFPNPSSTGTFNLMFEDGSSLRDVVVSDVSGRVVKQYKAVSGNTLTVEGLTDGFYTVQVANRNSGTTSIEKVIIKKR